MGHMKSEMVGMPSRKCQWARNTSYYGLQVVHCVWRSHQYHISSKMTKYTLRAVACSSTIKAWWPGTDTWLSIHLSSALTNDPRVCCVKSELNHRTQFSTSTNNKLSTRQNRQQDFARNQTKNLPIRPNDPERPVWQMVLAWKNKGQQKKTRPQWRQCGPAQCLKQFGAGQMK